MVEWLQCHPVTVRGTGSNPVGAARQVIVRVKLKLRYLR